MLYGVVRCLAAVVARLPWRALRVPGAALGWLAGTLVAIRRAHVEAAMARAGVARPRREASAMYRSLGTSLFELLWLAGRARGSLAAKVRIDAASAARWQAALGAGRGVVVAASHTGNWDLAACAIAERCELLVVTKRLSVRGLDRFWQRARAARGVALCEAEGALGRARGTLARGGAVAMMIDQVPSRARHATTAPFAGAPALVDRAPAILAARTRAPLVVAAAERAADGHVLHVLDVIDPPDGGCVRAWADAASERATAALERFVLEHPSDWLWMHRRWRAPRDADAGASDAARALVTE